MRVHRRANLYLLALPVGLMGLVQLVFALLSLALFEDGVMEDFLFSSLPMLGVAVWMLSSRSDWRDHPIGLRDSLVFAVMTWVIMGLLGAIPVMEITGVSFTDAVFESVSALTTTGATILDNLDSRPKAFLMYRQFLQWLGGLGVVIFVVAILPMLNTGGMKLLKAETPGPIKDDKLSPRISSSAHYLFIVYMVLTFTCAVGYFLAGMDLFDALGHSFSTVSTGGFSTHDASIGYFKSDAVLWVANLFMLLGAISFAVHFRAMSGRSLKIYWRDEESRVFLLTVLFISLLITSELLEAGIYHHPWDAFQMAMFHMISFVTSTGFGAADFTHWPAFVALTLVISGYLGGCSGSTAGGNKFIRNILSLKLIALEIKRIMHPRGVFILKYQGKSLQVSVLSSTIMFMALVATSTVVLTLILMGTGLSFWGALSAVAACLNVLGPAFGELGSNFQPVTDFGTWVLSFAMILGRLEYFTVLTLFLPVFWRF